MSVYEDIYHKAGLSSTHQQIIDLVGKDKKVLEVGSSGGYITKELKKNGCVVDVVELDQHSAKRASVFASNVYIGSIEDQKVIEKLGKDYNVIVLADVLEHLANPQLVLSKLFELGVNSTQLIISTPNIACWPIRKQLFFDGNFQYQDSGILDKTHLHFYTTKTLSKDVVLAKWKVKKLIGSVIRLPFEGFFNKIPLLNLLFKLIKKDLAENFKNLSYIHMILVAEK